METVTACDPLGPAIVVQRDPVPEHDRDGNEIPSKYRKKPREATVVAVGPGWITPHGKPVSLDLNAGDRIITQHHADHVEFIQDGKTLAGVSIDAVLAVETPDAPGGYTPLGPRVIVRRFTPEDKSEGGIVYPDQCLDDRRLAEIIAVGSGGITEFGVQIPPRVQPGQFCLMVKWKGVTLEQKDGSDLLVMDESDCMVRVTVTKEQKEHDPYR